MTTAFIAAILLTQSLTAPLTSLVQGMHKVSEGELDVQIRVRARDEIGVLANSFNTMILDLKRSREELQEINHELENKVKDRTRQLEQQNQAVKSAQEALLRSTRLAAVGEIAGRAAHEVLNPLTSLLTRVQRVKKKLNEGCASDLQMLDQFRVDWSRDFDEGGFARLVQTWQQPSKVQAGWTLWQEDIDNLRQMQETFRGLLANLATDAEFVIREGERINRIVQNMRSLSHVHRVPVIKSCHELLTQCIHIMADLFNQHEVEIKPQLTAMDDQVLVDPDEFVQSITNLLRNSLQAVVALPDRPIGAWVKVETRNVNGAIEIALTDNGTGIDGELQSRLFEANFTTKSREDGTGLGLSISRRFIRSFGGDIVFIESRPGEKTQFVITLPVQGVAKGIAV